MVEIQVDVDGTDRDQVDPFMFGYKGMKGYHSLSFWLFDEIFQLFLKSVIREILSNRI